MYSPVDVSRIQYMTLKQQRAARRKQAQKLLTRQMAKVTVQAPPQKKKKNKPFATVGQTLGTAVGSMFGAPTIGSGVGRWLGKGIGSIFGSGDYEMVGQNPSYNVLTNGAQIPKFSSTRQTNIVCHREYLGDITGTTAFTNRSFSLNPGDPGTFPWLSTIAQNYQQFKFHGLIFEFRPLITDFVTSGAPGVVVMATNYNADEPAYQTKQEMENSEYAVSVKPTCNLMHGVECATNQTVLSELYVRVGGLASNLDLKFTDLGKFQFASQGNPVQLLGELWVSYNVEFFKPILPKDVGGNVLSQNFNVSGYTDAAPLGGTINKNVGDLPDATVFNGNSISWKANPGNFYLVSVRWKGTAAPIALTYPNTTLTGCSGALAFDNGTSFTSTAPQTGIAADLFAQLQIMVQCTLGAPGNVIVTLSNTGTLPTGTRSYDVYVTSFSSEAI